MQKRRLVTFAVLALCYSACNRGESPSREVAADEESLAVADQPRPARASSDDHLTTSDDNRPILLMVTQVDEVANEEGGVVFRGIDSPSAPGPHLHDTVLYADVRALANTLAPGAELVVEGTAVRIDDRSLPVPAHDHGRALYVAVRRFAREFGAYSQTMDQRGSTTIWPQDVLQYLVKERTTEPPVVKAARAEGILPPAQ